MKPWEKYQTSKPSGPWDRYATKEDVSLPDMLNQDLEKIKDIKIPSLKADFPKQEKTEEPETSFAQDVGQEFGKRSTAVAAGGMIGAAAGSPFFPPLGTLAGGAIGAAAGSAFHDARKSAQAMFEGKPEDVVPMGEQFKTMAGEARTDILFSMGGMVLRPVLWGRQLLSKISGLTTEASKSLQETAKGLGIGLGAVDVGGVVPKAYAKTIGVFPFVGSPMRRAQISKIADVERAVNETLNAFGPSHATAQSLGIDMVAAARGTHKEFRKVSSGLYENFNETVRTASRQDIIPTVEAKKYASEIAKEVRGGLITLKNGEPLSPAIRQETIDYLTRFSELPDLITPAQYRRLTAQELPDLIGKHLKDGVDIRQITKMKGALESDFANIRTDLLPKGEAEAVKTALDTANKFYAKGIVQFQTKAAKAFQRVDANIFKAGAGKPGSLNADELYDVAVNLKSPKQIQDLTRLVGKRNMKQAAALNFETAIESSRSSIELMGKEYQIVDPEKLERALKLTGASKQKLSGIRELYRTAGVDLKQVQDLVGVMKRIEGIGNPAEFIRRRAILAGVTGLGAAAGVGGAAAISGAPGGVVTAGGLTLLGRHFSKIFSSPLKLKQLTTVLDEARNTAIRQAVLGRLTKALLSEEEGD